MHEVYEFHTNYTSKMVDNNGVHRTTIYRWLRQGRIKAFKSMNGDWLFSLNEINRIRKLRGCNPLTKEEAYKFWETN